MAVGHKTGGRQRGTRNKASIEKEQKIAESGLTPLDYMLGILRDTKATYDMRIEAAKSAAPYVHPKLAALTVAGQIDSKVEMTVEEREAAERRRVEEAQAIIDRAFGATTVETV